METTYVCKNCGRKDLEAFNFCPDCGQKWALKLTYPILFNNAIRNYFSKEALFFKSLVPMIFSPGRLPQKFVLGKRESVMHPGKFYVFFSVLFFFLFSIASRKQQQHFDKTMQEKLVNNLTLDSLKSLALNPEMTFGIDSLGLGSIPLAEKVKSVIAEPVNKVTSFMRKDSITEEIIEEAVENEFAIDSLNRDMLDMAIDTLNTERNTAEISEIKLESDSLNIKNDITQEKDSLSVSLDIIDTLAVAPFEEEWPEEEFDMEYEIILIPRKRTPITWALDTAAISVTDVKYWKPRLDTLITYNATKGEKMKLFGLNSESKNFKTYVAGQLLKVYEKRFGGLMKIFLDSIPPVMFLLLPIFALLLKFFFNRKLRMPSHVVFSLYYFSFIFFVLSLLVLINLFYPLPNWINLGIVLSGFIYLLYAAKRFYHKSWFKTFLKSFAVVATYLTLVLPLSVFLVVFIAILRY